MPDLSDWITPEALLECAGQTLFERGEAYFRHGAVSRLRDGGSKVSARVDGTESYHVELWTDGDELDYDCTCPHAAEGNFCKHCVAVGLAFLVEREHTGGAEKPSQTRDPWSSVREYLALQPPETLIDWLLDAAERNDGLYRTLLLRAERAGGSVDMAKVFRREIDSATRNGDEERIQQLADSLAELLEPESADMLVDLAEYAIPRVEGMLEQTEDEGIEVQEALGQLGELHLRACELARPDPVLLAERLFRYETSASFDAFCNSVRTYREVLGPSGLRRFRELAEEAWREVPPRTSEARGFDRGESGRWRITHIMETLAELSGDIDALVAVKSRDLSSGFSYLKIAEIYRDANRPDEELDWAERGIKAFPDRPDNRLRDFLAAAYLERGRHDEALRLVWVQFAERPELELYQKLHDMADRLGVWPQQRERALAELDATIQRRANTTDSRWKPRPSVPDYSERVRIALWENDLEAAWQAIQQGACRQDWLVTLAGRLEASRPSDAVALYRRVIPTLVVQTNNTAYEQAVRLVRKVGGLMRDLGQAAEFGNYLAELRVSYKPKRNFIKLLDGVIAQAG